MTEREAVMLARDEDNDHTLLLNYGFTTSGLDKVDLDTKNANPFWLVLDAMISSSNSIKEISMDGETEEFDPMDATAFDFSPQRLQDVKGCLATLTDLDLILQFPKFGEGYDVEKEDRIEENIAGILGNCHQSEKSLPLQELWGILG